MGSLWGAHFSKNSVSLETNRDISVLFEDLTSVEAPPPINPPNHPYTHPWVGEPPQMSNLQTELKYLDSF